MSCSLLLPIPLSPPFSLVLAPALQNGFFIVAGNAKQMPKDVRKALTAVVQAFHPTALGGTLPAGPATSPAPVRAPAPSPFPPAASPSQSPMNDDDVGGDAGVDVGVDAAPAPPSDWATAVPRGVSEQEAAQVVAALIAQGRYIVECWY